METKDVILQLRTQKGLSQDELAERILVTRQAVSRWENGETVPNTETLKLLSKEFDVSINTLLGTPRQLVCQCCGMPLEDAIISHNKDGSPNEDYCKWCYADGTYTYTVRAKGYAKVSQTLKVSGDVTVPVALFFAVVGSWWGYENDLGVFAAAMVGGLIGFLVYNFHPAKVFMGDTGSLFLGGAVAGLAFAYDMPLVLLLVGIVYICETLSDIIQVAYFKATHGKRIFKMAPLHHHFELCGWSEVKLVTIFTLVSAVFCMLALWGVIGRYHF